jgi:hypothetical protein
MIYQRPEISAKGAITKLTQHMVKCIVPFLDFGGPAPVPEDRFNIVPAYEVDE